MSGQSSSSRRRPKARANSHRANKVHHDWLNNAAVSESSEPSSGGIRSYTSSALDADDEYESICTEDEVKDTTGLPNDNSFDVVRLKRLSDQYKFKARHMAVFYRLFKHLDKDGSSTIDKSELFDWLGEPFNLFSRRLFELVDVPRKGHLDFVAFVKVLTTYALFGHDDILKFCFFAFDSNSNGSIDHNELHQLVSFLHGDEESRFYNIELVLQKFDQNLDGVISFDEFREINRRHPFVIYPAFRMQRHIEEKTFGSRWWYRHRTRLAREQRRRAMQGTATPPTVLGALGWFYKQWLARATSRASVSAPGLGAAKPSAQEPREEN